MSSVQAARQLDQLPPPRTVEALEVDERAQLAPCSPRDGPASSLAPIGVDHGGVGHEDDLTAGVPDAEAPVGVVPAEEDSVVERPGRSRELRAKQLARAEHVKHGPGRRVVEVGHQVPAHGTSPLEDPVERRPAEQRQ